MVGDGVLLGVVVLGGSGDNEDDLGGEGGDNLGGARSGGSEVDVDTLGLLDVDGGESTVGLDVDLLSVQDVDGGDDVVEDNIGLNGTLCRWRLRFKVGTTKTGESAEMDQHTKKQRKKRVLACKKTEGRH